MMLRYQRCNLGKLLPPSVLKGQEEKRECWHGKRVCLVVAVVRGGCHSSQKCGIREEVGKSIPT